jgi:dynein heavy chain|tara:strand:+ start:52 stop:816 length:765 start_codon:yes stop_codon:yes gene_type:complete
LQEHFSKFTDATGAIEWQRDAEENETGVALGCVAVQGERISYPTPYLCEGQVEDWLSGLMAHQQGALRTRLSEAIGAFLEQPRDKFVLGQCAQLAITSSQIWWTTEVNNCFDRLEVGNEGAMKDYLNTCVQGLALWSSMVLGELTAEQRTKLKTCITIDVHARDIVAKLVAERVESANAFAWQSQLKYVWDDERRDCFIEICDAEFKYSYEYVGNPGRLVITALTDRCYITLTQASKGFDFASLPAYGTLPCFL